MADKSLEEMVETAERSDAVRVLLYGPHGIGKSTFGAAAEDPVFICAETGVGELGKIKCFTPRSGLKDWPATLRMLERLGAEAHPWRTLVVDTLDWIQPQMVEHVCRRDDGSNRRVTMVDGRPDIEGYGFGKGWGVVQQEWRLFLAAVERCWLRGMNVILLAHSDVQKEKNQEGNDYGVIAPAIHRTASSLLMEWVDAVFYADHEKRVVAVGDSFTKRDKVVATDRRIMYTKVDGAHKAKSRYTLPTEMPLSYHAFRAAIAANDPAVAKDLRDQIVAAIRQVRSEARATETRTWLDVAGNNVAELRGYLTGLKTELEDARKAREELFAAVDATGNAKKIEDVRAWALTRAGLNLEVLKAALAKVRGAEPPLTAATAS